jgi:4-amino-4-deoxy-L-arabinose transferase-like glycosyltransferase
MQYISFDYVCWVWVAYCVVRLLGGGEARWWIGIGAGIGLGMMAKYTMAFLAAGVVAGVLLTDVRRHCKSKWLCIGAGVAVLILLPNLIWQVRRDFVAVAFLRFLHERDVATGVTDWFLAGQLELTLLAFPLAGAGLWFCLFSNEGKRYRMVGWMYAVPLVLFLVMRGRDYYLAPAYPMLYAAGAVWGEKWMMRQREASKEAEKQGSKGAGREARPDANGDTWAPWIRGAIWAVLAVDVVLAGAVALPLAPVNSAWWKLVAKVDVVFPEEIGWPEFVETVAQVRDQLPRSEREELGILAGNYGEVGALNLYGEKYGLPRAISGVNSSWERGYGNPAPETLIVVGFQRDFLERHFASCELAARTWNRYGVANEETVEDPDIFVCRGLRGGWEAFWKEVRGFA